MAKLIDLTGQRFDKLVVLEKAESKKKHTNWKCQCDCGNICERTSEYLKANIIPRDCGCSKKITQKKKRAEERENRLVGQRFGRLTVIKRIDRTTANKKSYYWLCQCDCGNFKEVPTINLTSGHTQSCGCLQLDTHLINITGQKFNKLTALYKDPQDGRKWICQCECDNITSVNSYALRNGLTQSCGCINYSIGEKHIYDILTLNNIKFIKEYTNSELNRKRFDFAILNEEEKIIRLIEFDGIQHYKETWSGWKKEGDSLENNQRRDREKDKYALSHNIPLVRIPYWMRDKITLDMLLGDEYLVKNSEP